MDSKLSSRVLKILCLGLVFHLFYIISVFDCYFTSPVVNGMQQFRVRQAKAKRLVLIVGKLSCDGLRADLLMNLNPFPTIADSPEVVAPYLRSIAETRGAFGVSHTRVPTESRPGHVAIIAGMYEDVSAVTKGWKTNPVEFDSVFNQSSHTFSFGSPDILPMFARGAIPGKVKTWMYNEDDEDFTKDATALDIWVIEQLETLLRNATTDRTLDRQLREDGVVFFLHLLGLDTTGHSYRPHSKEYMHNIEVVDNIVKRTELLLKKFYRDDETSYIFTADHGMSNIGNHGDGNPDSTRTPLIAWGKGIRGPLPDTVISSHDNYSRPWGLDKFVRQDVEQADIAPLMTTLLGINLPVNSVGVVPDVDPVSPGYLRPKGGEREKAEAAVVNARSILEQYRVKHRLKAEHSVSYQPFPQLTPANGPTSIPGTQELVEIEQLVTLEHWAEARKKSMELIRVALEGLRYLQTYDRILLRSIVTAGYIGWAAFSAASLISSDSTGPSPSRTSRLGLPIIAGSVLLGFWGRFAVQKSPWTYYAYVAFPCYFWYETIRLTLPFALRGTSHSQSAGLSTFQLKSLGISAAVILSLQGMVAAYTNRAIWSIGFVAIGVYWPLVHWPSSIRQEDPIFLVRWAISCLSTALFPLRDVEQRESSSLIVAGGVAMICVGSVSAYVLTQSDSQRKRIVPTSLLFIGLSTLVTYDSVVRLQTKVGLPFVNKALNWTLLFLSASYPKLSRMQYPNEYSKLLGLFLAFAPCFVILSIAAEGLFYLSYCATLITWIGVETKVRAHTRKAQNLSKAESYQPTLDDVRIALFFLFFVQVAFFGTGNVASVSSFYLEPVYRLVPVFNPFIMASLLIFKIIAPYVMLSAVFATLNSQLGLPPFSLFLIALSMTDMMTITFFLNVTDTGSWLEIGQSISFFVIASLLLVWSAGICILGEWLMSGSTNDHRLQKKRKLQ
ncbi:PigN-domain-containing protein [Rickenella mellea]|uniref:GPI ethanolamine phosphate transferase 1 n=1 Tax=Rickenella mellea TaxID=50990 RepID=A0A4Y7QHH2_9AGAM|nr:PigN-domain-containing protein [Rickenella mellea]